MLDGIEISLPNKTHPYNRNSYSYGIDHDQNGFDTRAEILINSSQTPVQFDGKNKTRVKSGKWFDLYTGVTFYDAKDIDVDHLVPLYKVHISGCYAWNADKKRAYANAIRNKGPLRITHRWTNRVPKRADDPSEYSPSYVPGRCQYLRDWVSIKRDWGLTMDPNEALAIKQQMAACTT